MVATVVLHCETLVYVQIYEHAIKPTGVGERHEYYVHRPTDNLLMVVGIDGALYILQLTGSVKRYASHIEASVDYPGGPCQVAKIILDNTI